MSIIEDPKETLKNLLEGNIVLYKDDGITPANFLICNEFNEEFWQKYDVIITIGLIEQKDKLLNLDGSQREIIASYRIGIWTRDTEGIDGQKMRWRTIQEITRIINFYGKTPGGALAWMKLTGRLDDDKTNLKPILYHSRIIVETRRYEKI
jgi:hypothetical protein